jgi:hypothetical protein
MQENLKVWVENQITDPIDSFQGRFKAAPSDTLQAKSFQLHDSYSRLLDDLSENEKEAVAQIFVDIATAENADALRQIYRDWVDHYELFFGWEGLQEEGPRGWCI